MRAWLRLHAHACGDALRRLAAQPLGAAAAIAVLAIAMTLPIVGAIALRSLNVVASHVQADPQVSVFLALDATGADAKRVEQALRVDPVVAAVRFVPKGQALEELKTTTHLADLLAAFDNNPLPDAFAVRLRSRDAGASAPARAAWSKLAKVDQVLADFDWAERLARWLAFADRLVAAIAIMLAAAVVFIVAHLIRLQVVSQREEIEVSQLIGATAADVRRPFVYHGLLQAALAAALALGASALGAAWLGAELRALTPQYASDFKVIFLTSGEAGGILVAAAVLGFGGAWWAVQRELRHFSKVA